MSSKLWEKISDNISHECVSMSTSNYSQDLYSVIMLMKKFAIYFFSFLLARFWSRTRKLHTTHSRIHEQIHLKRIWNAYFYFHRKFSSRCGLWSVCVDWGFLLSSLAPPLCTLPSSQTIQIILREHENVIKMNYKCERGSKKSLQQCAWLSQHQNKSQF